MNSDNPFKWSHFQPEIILLCVRWYLRYPICYRDLEKMMVDRGLKVDHTTLNRWVIRYAPEIDQRSRPHIKLTNDSWRVDEIYVEANARRETGRRRRPTGVLCPALWHRCLNTQLNRVFMLELISYNKTHQTAVA